jgi:hypothetical protein
MTMTTHTDLRSAADELYNATPGGFSFYEEGYLASLTDDELRAERRNVAHEIHEASKDSDERRGGRVSPAFASLLLQHREIKAEQEGREARLDPVRRYEATRLPRPLVAKFPSGRQVTMARYATAICDHELLGMDASAKHARRVLTASDPYGLYHVAT